MGIECAGKTDIGKRRETNQDYFEICELSEALTLMVVCDGMGGANGGSEASSLAAETFVSFVKENISGKRKSEYLAVLEAALEKANMLVFNKARESKELEGMGTTLVCALYDGESYYCLWVGDSRIYVMTDDGISQISHDHSFVQTLVDSGNITAEEAKKHPNRNIITKAVGSGESLTGDVCKMSVENVCGLLLCSDGLCGYVDEERISEICREENDAVICCEKLVNEANDAGGVDNITVIIHKK